MPAKKTATSAETKTPHIRSPAKPKSPNATSATSAQKEAVKLPSLATCSPAKSSPAKSTAPLPTKPSSSSDRISSQATSPKKKTERSMTEAATPAQSCESTTNEVAPTLTDLREAKPPSASSHESSVSTETPADVGDNETSTAEAATLAEAAVVEAEAERVRKENGNGMVKLIYEQYDELFPIQDGSTTQANIDEVYCLSFVMPNCLVHLSHHPSAERYERENAGVFDSLVPENPQGVYQGLVKDSTYYVVVEQEAGRLKRDQEMARARWAPEIQANKQLEKNDGRGFESCSCIYGNPCVDEYGCRDWHSRFAIATANGWKGF